MEQRAPLNPRRHNPALTRWRTAPAPSVSAVPANSDTTPGIAFSRPLYAAADMYRQPNNFTFPEAQSAANYNQNYPYDPRPQTATRPTTGGSTVTYVNPRTSSLDHQNYSHYPGPSLDRIDTLDNQAYGGMTSSASANTFAGPSGQQQTDMYTTLTKVKTNTSSKGRHDQAPQHACMALYVPLTVGSSYNTDKVFKGIERID